jgi:HSP90 family molecular chaperone
MLSLLGPCAAKEEAAAEDSTDDEEEESEDDKAAEGDVEDDDEEEGDDAGKEEEKPKKTKKELRKEWDRLNDNKAIWLRSPSDVTKEEYQKFYKAVSKVGCSVCCVMAAQSPLMGSSMPTTQLHEGEDETRSVLIGATLSGRVQRPPVWLTRTSWNAVLSASAVLQDFGEALAHTHFKAEGDVEFKAVLYVPETAPYDFYDKYYDKAGSGLKLYVRRVFISDDFTDLIPR